MSPALRLVFANGGLVHFVVLQFRSALCILEIQAIPWSTVGSASVYNVQLIQYIEAKLRGGTCKIMQNK